jgi:hypothetical protein
VINEYGTAIPEEGAVDGRNSVEGRRRESNPGFRQHG